MRSTVLALVTFTACGGDAKPAEPPPGNGPAFTPGMSYDLRAIAADCKLERLGTVERRDCTGRHGKVQIAMAGGRLSSLVIALPSKILPEATSHIGAGLATVIGAPGVATVTEAMKQLKLGDRTEITVGTARIALTAGGRSEQAPAYSAELTWP